VDDKGGRPKERFCKRGHDTHEVGRIRHGYCKACADAGPYGPPKMPHDPEWERARVARWLEIVEEDPIDEVGGTHVRMKAFEARYARLEAAVPRVDA